MTGWESQISIVAGVTVLAVISPGPDFAVTSRNSLLFGRRAGLATATGIACGVSVHVAYTLLGLGYVIATAAWVLEVLRYGGAAYLIYLGLTSFRSAKPQASLPDPKASEQSIWRMFRNGFLCNAFNPKTALFFIALFSQAVAPDTPVAAQGAFGLFIAGAHLLWFSMVACFLTHQKIERLFTKARHWLERLIGICLIGLGAKLAISQ